MGAGASHRTAGGLQSLDIYKGEGGLGVGAREAAPRQAEKRKKPLRVVGKSTTRPPTTKS